MPFHRIGGKKRPPSSEIHVGKSKQGAEYMLDGKTVLVAGGSSGIGLAVASLAHKNGAHVIIATRNAVKQNDRLTDLVGKTIETHSLNITSDESVYGLFQAVSSIDHLVITVRPEIKSSLFLEGEIREAKQALDTKFWGTYRLIRAAQPHFRQYGSITLTSGIAGEKVYKGA